MNVSRSIASARALLFVLTPIAIVVCVFCRPASLLGAPAPAATRIFETVCRDSGSASIQTSGLPGQGRTRPPSLGIPGKGLLPRRGVAYPPLWPSESSKTPRRPVDRLQHLLDQAVQDHRRLETLEEELELLKLEKRRLQEQLKELLNTRLR